MECTSLIPTFAFFCFYIHKIVQIRSLNRTFIFILKRLFQKLTFLKYLVIQRRFLSPLSNRLDENMITFWLRRHAHYQAKRSIPLRTLTGVLPPQLRHPPKCDNSRKSNTPPKKAIQRVDRTIQLPNRYSATRTGTPAEKVLHHHRAQR
jgi:hypothetical protein